MNLTLDRNLFTQIGLDSGALTMHGSVIHSFGEAGEYRGVVRRGGTHEAVFYIKAEKEAAIAQINIDLAKLTKAAPPPGSDDKCCSGTGTPSEQHFTVNAKGFAVFYVSAGPGGFDVHIEGVAVEREQRVFDSRKLSTGDVFSGSILRPGKYSVRNLLSKAVGEIVVSYPEIGKSRYQPGPPVRVQSYEDRLDPAAVKVTPGQGLVFECKSPTRIKVELLQPDDGPGPQRDSRGRGWRKTTLPNMAEEVAALRAARAAKPRQNDGTSKFTKRS